MYAMRYGALPVVRRTGGLADTVDARNGFVFEAAEPDALAGAVREARTLFDSPPAWRARMATAIATDHSWGRAAQAYLDWYGRLKARMAASR
jgi:starch synthase